MSWATVTVAGIGLTGTVLGISSKETTLCGKQCRAKCRDKSGFLIFGEKASCKKDCKANCLEAPTDIKEKQLRLDQEKIAQTQKNIEIALLGLVGLAVIIGIIILVVNKLKKQ